MWPHLKVAKISIMSALLWCPCKLAIIWLHLCWQGRQGQHGFWEVKPSQDTCSSWRLHIHLTTSICKLSANVEEEGEAEAALSTYSLCSQLITDCGGSPRWDAVSDNDLILGFKDAHTVWIKPLVWDYGDGTHDSQLQGTCLSFAVTTSCLEYVSKTSRHKQAASIFQIKILQSLFTCLLEAKKL